MRGFADTIRTRDSPVNLGSERQHFTWAHLKSIWEIPRGVAGVRERTPQRETAGRAFRLPDVRPPQRARRRAGELRSKARSPAGARSQYPPREEGIGPALRQTPRGR